MINNNAPDYAVIILNKYPEYARNLIESIRKTHKVMPTICVVRDGHQETFGDDVACIDGKAPFIYARNANLGIAHYPDRITDIILCNDDTTCIMEDFFHLLHKKGNALYPAKVGILSPLIDGGVGSHLQQYPENMLYWEKANQAGADTIESGQTVCFPCVWLSREAVDAIGPLDENMVGYGHDDDDYCIRARHAGWKCAVTRSLVIKHGTGGNRLDYGKNWSSSFARNGGARSNQQVFMDKYHIRK